MKINIIIRLRSVNVLLLQRYLACVFNFRKSGVKLLQDNTGKFRQMAARVVKLQ